MDLQDILAIRYIKLHFTIMFPETAILPENKVSMLRGGMGEMLLRANCISDRECETCDFERECIVRRTMYSKFEIKPSFVTTGESVGYVLECEDRREVFEPGDRMEFQMIIFGKTLVYFSQFLQAFFSLGMQGIGKEKAKFQIVSIGNSGRKPILVNGNIRMEEYRVKRILDYVSGRLRQLSERLKECTSVRLQFETPLTIKYQGEILTEFHAQALITAVKRRLYMLGCFENIDCESYYRKEFQIPEIIRQEHYPVSVKRVSFRKNDKLILRGIKGYMVLKEIDDEVLCLLLAGELIHVGKNTSFGFGKYRVIPRACEKNL